MKNLNDIREEFEHIELNQLGRAKARRIAIAFSQLLDNLELDCDPTTPEMVEATTRLQEAYYFVQIALAMNEHHRKHNE